MEIQTGLNEHVDPQNFLIKWKKSEVENITKQHDYTILSKHTGHVGISVSPSTGR